MNLIGIVSFEKDYRLCFFLNQQLNLNLTLSDDKLHINLNKTDLALTYFKGYNIDFEFFLFENNVNGTKLFPKYKNINYWLMITNKTYNKEINEIEQQINKIDAVIGSFRFSNIKDLSQLAELEFS
jgi:hypothetical protein